MRGDNMLLVDKQIKKLIENGELIIENYVADNLNGVSYDLTIDVIYGENLPELEYELEPGEVVFVKTMEKISIPHNILGRVAEKNSRMRQGLRVDAPYYQPGHTTNVFLRVQNISKDIIVLKKGIQIAQIMFEELCEEPDMPYDKQKGASFQGEQKYIGLGNYQKEYESQTKKVIENARTDIDRMSQTIYGNVLTIMGVLVAIFSLISINYQAFTQSQLTIPFILVMNLSMALAVVLMLGVILLLINQAKSKGFLISYISVIIALIVANIVCVLTIL